MSFNPEHFDTKLALLSQKEPELWLIMLIIFFDFEGKLWKNEHNFGSF